MQYALRESAYVQRYSRAPNSLDKTLGEASPECIRGVGIVAFSGGGRTARPRWLLDNSLLGSQ